MGANLYTVPDYPKCPPSNRVKCRFCHALILVNLRFYYLFFTWDKQPAKVGNKYTYIGGVSGRWMGEIYSTITPYSSAMCLGAYTHLSHKFFFYFTYLNVHVCFFVCVQPVQFYPKCTHTIQNYFLSWLRHKTAVLWQLKYRFILCEYS